MGCIPAKDTVLKIRVIDPPEDKVKSADFRLLTNNYSIQPQILGRGKFGKVYVGHHRDNPALKVAVKVISKKKIPWGLYLLQSEIKILSKLDHPNICRYYESYESPKHFFLIMERCAGGDLLERIALADQHFSEEKAALIMKKLLLAVNHCHSQGVIHRDLKPENIMYKESRTRIDDIKIIDFGLSKIDTARSKEELTTIVGTPAYIAPEVIDGRYGEECDVWSLGVIMYLMLSGQLPFFSSNARDLFEKIQHEDLTFNDGFQGTSHFAKDLIRRLLIKDPEQRITCAEALQHRWFEEEHANTHIKFDDSIIQRLTRFRGISALRKEALSVLVKMLNTNQMQTLSDIFAELDVD